MIEPVFVNAKETSKIIINYACIPLKWKLENIFIC